MDKFAGAEWMQDQLDASHKSNPSKHPEVKMAPLGIKAADLLGEWQRGIYHLQMRALYKVDWANTHWIEITIYCAGMSTYDFDDLTRLVFLAHERCIRIELEPATHHYMKIMFHERTHEEHVGIGRFHPSLEEAVALFKQTVYEEAK